MTSFARYRSEWFGPHIHIPTELISGILVALALIPEAISFSIIAGVDPKVGLYASFSIAVTLAFAGGRPGMISAATASMAVLFIDLIRDHGLQYLLATTILIGILQIVAGLLRIDRMMGFVSRSVMTGFVNALAILIFLAQVPEMTGVPGLTYPLIAVGLALIYLLPRVTNILPSPLITIVLLTGAAMLFGFDVRTVGDMGELPSSFPVFLFPDVPLNLETVRIILPTALAATIVGLLESLLTASLIDDIADTKSSKRRECFGQGLGNFVTGFFGGMGGCAMIGQSMINTRAGGRGRLSTFTAGAFLLFLVVILGDLVGRIPMAALVAVMIFVSVSTFKWSSLGELRTHPVSSSLVMVATVATVVATRNLALGVLVGVVISGLGFAWRLAQSTHVHRTDLPGDARVQHYLVTGQVFFASAGAFMERFDFDARPERVTIDLGGAHLWDTSAVQALERIVSKFERNGAVVEVIGLNETSATLRARVGIAGTVTH